MTIGKLAEKLAKASIDVGHFVADKTNQEQHYSYISADQVLDKAGDALARNGIAIIPNVETQAVNAVERQGKSPRLDAYVNLSMLVTDGETEWVASWVGFGSDYSVPDKAIYKAITSGHKYFLMKLLNIGVGNEDGDHEQDEETGKKAAPKPAPKIEKSAELLEAEARTNSDGVKYGDIDTPTLANMINSMATALKKNDITADYKDITTKKLAAAKLIIESRNGK